MNLTTGFDKQKPMENTVVRLAEIIFLSFQERFYLKANGPSKIVRVSKRFKYFSLREPNVRPCIDRGPLIPIIRTVRID